MVQIVGWLIKICVLNTQQFQEDRAMGSQGNGNYQEKQEFQGWCDTMPQLCNKQVPFKDHPSLLAQHPVTYDPEWPLTSW